MRTLPSLVATLAALAAMAGCESSTGVDAPLAKQQAGATPTGGRPTDRAAEPGATDARTTPTTSPRASAGGPEPSPTVSGSTVLGEQIGVRPPAVPSAGRPRRALLSLPSIGVRDLPVVPYRGWTDDAPGTDIQNGGVAASPFGPRGGVGPGGIGNYQVTAHRTSSTRAFELLPQMQRGDRIIVVAAKERYIYEVRRTRETSFRSPRSLAEQRAAVPGRPGAVPSRAYITLSTCATQEDHAAGNYWADQFDNPEHRIDKIGVLVRTDVVPD